jgi:hypothetical protein
VLLQRGRLMAAGDLANKMITDPKALSRHYVPESPDVLVYSDMANPGTNFAIHFNAPREPGEYPFSFVPQKPGSYLAWVDVRARPLGLQEYIRTTIEATTASESLIDRTVTNRAVVEGMTFELSFATEKLRSGRPTIGKLRITGTDGNPFAQLEPLMNAFVHLVGFHEDRKTVLHMHPKGPLVTDPTSRGGPEIEFQMFPLHSGFVRLFA